MSYDPLAVANHFILSAQVNGQPIDAMKLQRLVYLAAAWGLAVYRRFLIEEDIVAEDYGPSIPSLDEALAPFGNEPIDGFFRGQSGEAPMIPSEDHPTLDLLKQIWQEYGRFSGVQLANLTHLPDSPWKLTRNLYPHDRTPVIPGHLLESHYRKLATDRNAGTAR